MRLWMELWTIEIDKFEDEYECTYVCAANAIVNEIVTIEIAIFGGDHECTYVLGHQFAPQYTQGTTLWTWL